MKRQQTHNKRVQRTPAAPMTRNVMPAVGEQQDSHVMDTNRIGIQMLRWGVAIALVLAFLYLLNLSMFHLWAGSGPPTSNPEWHIRWGYFFLGMSFGALFACFGTLWFLRPRRKRNMTADDLRE